MSPGRDRILSSMPAESERAPDVKREQVGTVMGERALANTPTGTGELVAESADLRSRIVASLADQGFRISGRSLVPPDALSKGQIRKLHREAAAHNRARSRAGLEKHESRLLTHVANGSDVVPEAVRPALDLVKPGSDDELLFRFARLHWSIPVSAGYGRRMRFLVRDRSNGKLIGIIGLGDPVFGLRPRDEWIGWDYETRRRRLRNVMDLFVLGAVPPYSALLCGKLVAILATSREVIAEFRRKYGGRASYIRQKSFDGRLALLTTTSALGRSSVYNRLRCDGGARYRSVGYTSGSGDFHFCNGFYRDLRQFALEHCDATAKHEAWGNGFRNRRELVRKTLPLLGLSTKLMYHGVKREVFVVPLAENSTAYLRGDDSRLQYYDKGVDDIFEWFKYRWLLPRAKRDRSYRDYRRQEYRLWGKA